MFLLLIGAMQFYPWFGSCRLMFAKHGKFVLLRYDKWTLWNLRKKSGKSIMQKYGKSRSVQKSAKTNFFHFERRRPAFTFPLVYYFWYTDLLS